MTDAVTYIDRVHTDLLDLFDRVRRPDEDRPAVLRQIMRTWADHAEDEYCVLVPALRRHATDGDRLATAIERDHHDVEHLLTRLERRKVNSPDVPGLVTDLLHLTQRHAEHGRAEVLPALRGAMDDAALDELGAALTADRSQEIHGHHDAQPDEGPVAQVLRKAGEALHHHHLP